MTSIDLTIPAFLQRNKGDDMQPVQQPRDELAEALDGVEGVENSAPVAQPQPQEPSIEEMLATIKAMSAKRDAMSETISKLKKQVQRKIGSL